MAKHSCHTYLDRDGKYKTCLYCSSAILYYCNCGWKYRHGLNPKNPLSEENEKNKPEWLNGFELFYRTNPDKKYSDSFIQIIDGVIVDDDIT